MNILHTDAGQTIRRDTQDQWASSPKETQDLLFSPRLNQEQEQRQKSNLGRSSLERTREDMLATNQLDNRYSVEKARTSLDLPGVTHAASLVGKRKSTTREIL